MPNHGGYHVRSANPVHFYGRDYAWFEYKGNFEHAYAPDDRRPAPAIVAEVGDIGVHCRLCGEAGVVITGACPDSETDCPMCKKSPRDAVDDLLHDWNVFLDNYGEDEASAPINRRIEAALRTLAEVRGERDIYEKQSTRWMLLAESNAKERDAATQRAEKAERLLAESRDLITKAFPSLNPISTLGLWLDRVTRAIPAPACDPATNATGSSHNPQ